MRHHLRDLATIAVLAALAGAPSLAQSSQTLPAGFDSGAGGSGTAYPFNTTGDQSWQWHYDSGQFAATGPITITELYVRSLNMAALSAFSFASIEVVMASSPTDYTINGNGVQLGHSTTFAANLNPDATVVRPAAPWSGSAPTPAWLPLGLTTPFNYDPTLGNDFVVQVRKCGATTAWTANVMGTLCCNPNTGGNRYGDTSNCAATVSTFSNNEFVVVVKIDYLAENRLTIAQSGPGVGDLTVSLQQISPTGFEGWTLLSGITTLPSGTGPFLGLWPDINTWILLGYPYFPGNPFHFRTTDVGVFPNVPLYSPPGSMSSLTGTTIDAVVFLVDVSGLYVSRSALVRHTFQ